MQVVNPPLGRACRAVATGLMAVVAVAGLSAHATAQPSTATGSRASAIAAEETVESLFVDFLHYANLGRFTLAESKAQALLVHKDLDPVELVELSERHEDSIDTILILIGNSSISDTAQKVLNLIHRGEFELRKDPARIRVNIERLGGPPQSVALGIANLRNSGEYAIPYMIATLLDEGRQRLWTRVVMALPKIGKPAVNPLVEALGVDDDNVRQNIIEALGEIGYPQAVPYLREIMADPQAPADSQGAAQAAIGRIEALIGRSVHGSAAELYYRLAESFYHEDEAVQADPRVPEANVWNWLDREQALERVPVSRDIFGPIMAIRTAERAVRLQRDHHQATALWLAANVRREGRLNMDVESADPAEAGEPDPTWPDDRPRALYYTQAAGPRYAHFILARAVADQDSAVALGAIEALRATAGESSLIGTEDYKQPLAQSLRFSDLLVRIRAALALGQALPRSPFLDSELVVPTLSTALALSGGDQILVVDPDEANLNRVASALRATGREVVAEPNFLQGLEDARRSFQQLSGVFIATDVENPDAAGAINALRSEFLFEKTPVVLMYKRRQDRMAEDLADAHSFVTILPASVADADLAQSLERVYAETGKAVVDEGLADEISLEAARTLRTLSEDGRTVFDVSRAIPALISALEAGNEPLQTAAASVLALQNSPEAQRAIAQVALEASNPSSLRIAAFDSVAESAKRFSNRLESAQVDRLIRTVQEEEDLIIRTAASKALGALNLADDRTSHIIPLAAAP